MVFLPLILSLAAAPFVLAQSNNTELQIEAIEAHFNNSGIVPSLLATFTPSAVFNLSYEGVGAISPGQALTKARMSKSFNLEVECACSHRRHRGCANSSASRHSCKLFRQFDR